ncbi:DUF6443 domain-containing protein [Parapedobacter tibetensis]|uniref:DUF6443 domain-containing protein n=1 Tax=Parapedobacter tibetensis TaxID=2972951 RepID=UPI00214DD700|nr:DUF6443 domain-containing protein [Parapedobacter tibetensis]
MKKRTNEYSAQWAFFTLAMVLVFPLASWGQVNPTYSSYGGQQELYGTQSVRLLPGFHATAGSTLRVFITDDAELGTGGTSTQNYVQKTMFLRPGIQTPLLTGDAMRDITYYDGLGRALQEVRVKAAPNYHDVVVPIAHDAYGRQAYQYLPYATPTGAGGAFKANAVTAQASYYSGTPPTGQTANSFAYGQTVFEPSPLNRVQEQGFPGQVWQPGSRGASGGRTVMTVYTTNNTTGFDSPASTRRVVRYAVGSGGELTVSSVYPANSLHVAITRNENWGGATSGINSRLNTFEEYADKSGRVVLTRTFNLVNTNDLEILSTYYVYDDLGNLAYVLPPGRDADFNPDAGSLPVQAKLDQYAYQYRYDERNRVVERKIPGKGKEFIVYNRLDQVVATQNAEQRKKSPQEWSVTKYDGRGRAVLTGLWSHSGSSANTDYRLAVRDSAYAGGQWENRIGTGIGYSHSAWPRGAIGTMLTLHYYDDYSVPGFPAAYDKQSEHSKKINGLPTVSRTKVLGNGTGTTNMLWSAVYYDDQGREVRSISQHYQGGVIGTAKIDDITNEYSFTGQLLKSTRKHHIASTSSTAATVVTEHTYDHRERLRETRKSVNGAVPTVISRNTYNEVGQLATKELHRNPNGSYAQTVNYKYNPRGWLASTESELFKQYLKYQDGPVPQYNGNISRQEWQHAGTATQHYNYTYDRVGRLLSGITGSGKDERDIRYDRMGNITQLKRDAGGTLLSFSYGTSGNQLQTITNGLKTYTYDLNGNMTLDGRQDRSIGYNHHLNLPVSVTGVGNYVYDAAGRKLRSTLSGITTDYIDGVEWQGTALNVIHMEEGRILPDGSGSGYQYVLRDHLGNNRVVFNPGSPTVQKTDYYPFGSHYQSGTIFSPKDRYLYNGKELQDVTGYIDYGARFYDPFIGRWGSVDLLADSMRRHSPYNYAFNNPIRFIDPDGMRPDDPPGSKGEPSFLERFFTIILYGMNQAGAVVNESKGLPSDNFESNLQAFGKSFRDYTLILQGQNELIKPRVNSSNTFNQIDDISYVSSNRLTRSGVYDGVRAASKFLQGQGVPRAFRKQILQSYEIETISLQTAGNATFGLRFYGGAANQSGRYLFPTFTNYTNRNGLALPPNWNSMTGVSQFQVMPGSRYISGRTAAQGGIYSGGNYQMYINDLRNLKKIQ